jgi:hypothetical protein
MPVQVKRSVAIDVELRKLATAWSGITTKNLMQIGPSTSQVDAAGQLRNAGLEAAKLRQAAAVIAQVGREISRAVGQGMWIRF